MVRANYDIKEKEGRSGNLAEIIKFLERVAKETADTTFPARDIDPSPIKSQKQIHATHMEPVDPMSNSSNQHNSYSCPMCKEPHYLNQCSVFRGLSVAERTDFVKCQGLCMNCFHSSHQAEACTRSWVCNIEGCRAKRNRWLHPTMSAHPSTQLLNESKQRSQSQTSAITQTSNHHLSLTTKCTYHENVALPIIPILVKGSSQKVKKVYAMLDNGSTGSLCTERLVKELGISYQTSLASLTTVDREHQPIACKLADLEVQDVSESYSFKMCRVMTLESHNISSESYITSAALNSWPHLADLKMPTAEHHQVDLLIGQDYSKLPVPLEVRTGKDKEPFAIRTHLGWVVNGKLSCHNTTQKYSVHFAKKEQNLADVDPKKEEVEPYPAEAKALIGVSPSSMSKAKDTGDCRNYKFSKPTVDEAKEIESRKGTIKQTVQRNESEQEANDSENDELITSNTQTEVKDSDNTGKKRGPPSNKKGKDQDMKNAQTYELKAQIKGKVTERFGRMDITRNRARMNKKEEEMKDAETYTATDDKSFNSKMNTEDIIDKTQRKSKTTKTSKAKDDAGKYKPVRFQ